MKKLALVAAPLFHLRLEAMATNRGEAHIGKHVAKTGKVKKNNNKFFVFCRTGNGRGYHWQVDCTWQSIMQSQARNSQLNDVRSSHWQVYCPLQDKSMRKIDHFKGSTRAKQFVGG